MCIGPGTRKDITDWIRKADGPRSAQVHRIVVILSLRRNPSWLSDTEGSGPSKRVVSLKFGEDSESSLANEGGGKMGVIRAEIPSTLAGGRIASIHRKQSVKVTEVPGHYARSSSGRPPIPEHARHRLSLIRGQFSAQLNERLAYC